MGQVVVPPPATPTWDVGHYRKYPMPVRRRMRRAWRRKTRRQREIIRTAAELGVDVEPVLVDDAGRLR